MKLNPQQLVATRADGNTLVSACAGSGKTRTLVAKLLRCTEEFRDSNRRIACITYTNAAVHEIENRFRQYSQSTIGHRVEVSTIHSFCLNAVISNFYWRVAPFRQGYEILPTESDAFASIAESIVRKHGLSVKESIEALQNATRQADGSPVSRPELPDQVMIEFWAELERRGLLDYQSILYWTLRILAENPSILDGVASRYAWILIDEFQDTTDLQVDILRLIASRERTRFFMVGDERQSIFGFTGARPHLMQQFTSELSDPSSLPLSGNYRSSELIIECAEALLPTTSPMTAEGTNAGVGIRPQIIAANSAFEAITDRFIPHVESLGISLGSCAVLAPWWIKLFHLGRALRSYGIPVVGPGARPYKRSTHLIAPLAEEVAAYVAGPEGWRVRRLERVLTYLIEQAGGEVSSDLYGYRLRVVLFRILNAAAESAERSGSAADYLQALADFTGASLEACGAVSHEGAQRISNSSTTMMDDIVARGNDPTAMSVDDLGVFARSDQSMSLSTVHGSKGLEFDAVAIVDVHDGRFPHFAAASQDQIDESRRLLYVGATRARKLLYFVSDSENRRNRPSPFLADITHTCDST